MKRHRRIPVDTVDPTEIIHAAKAVGRLLSDLAATPQKRVHSAEQSPPLPEKEPRSREGRRERTKRAR